MSGPKVPRAPRITLRDFTRTDDFLHEYVTDVSQSGAFVRSHDPLPIGTRINLRFNVMVDRMEVVEAEAEVVRVSGEGMGVVFTDVPESSQHLLARLAERSEED